ncbi:hypothetical protein QYE76_064483 [Lolium multiflorum]|uniref:DUF295 domain-containing protein n=1 Tax=Lolium multiflorum TaxID=4521 RepID=A0AAD8S8E8_LOLMU|nr:hypothetical protein QYE76_064483 [Lolium multiflorum]
MAGGDGSNETAAEQWSSLPNDLLSTLYARLASPDDRVRFAAVCTSWRALALTDAGSPRPVLPWLMLDPRGGDKTKRVYIPEDGIVLQAVQIPSEAADGRFIAGYEGGWVVSSDVPLGIVNLFSGIEEVYSSEQRRIIRAQQSTAGNQLVMQKVIFSAAPTSGGCILAAITDKHGLALSRAGCPEGRWTTQEFHAEERLTDIAFCKGELYGLMRYRDCLVKFEIGVNEHGAPVLTAVHRLCIANSPNSCDLYTFRDTDNYARYIVELCGKLVMAVRHNWPAFTLLQLVHADGGRLMWANIVSLGDYALFLGWTCSKLVHVPEDSRGGVKKNHIYYTRHRCLRRDDKIPSNAKVLPTSSIDGGGRVYYKQDNSVYGGGGRIPSVEYYVKGGVCPPIWIFPPDM